MASSFEILKLHEGDEVTDVTEPEATEIRTVPPLYIRHEPPLDVYHLPLLPPPSAVIVTGASTTDVYASPFVQPFAEAIEENVNVFEPVLLPPPPLPLAVA